MKGTAAMSRSETLFRPILGWSAKGQGGDRPDDGVITSIDGRQCTRRWDHLIDRSSSRIWDSWCSGNVRGVPDVWKRTRDNPPPPWRDRIRVGCAVTSG